MNNYKCFTVLHKVLDLDTNTSTFYSTTYFHIVMSLLDTAAAIDNTKYHYYTTTNYCIKVYTCLMYRQNYKYYTVQQYYTLPHSARYKQTYN